MNSNFRSELEQALVSVEAFIPDENGIIQDVDEDVRKRSEILYAILASYCGPEPLKVVTEFEETAAGYCAWNALGLEYQPDSDNRRLALQEQIMEAKSLDTNQAGFMAGLRIWEKLITTLEQLKKSKFDEEIKRGILLNKSPGKNNNICALMHLLTRPTP